MINYTIVWWIFIDGFSTVQLIDWVLMIFWRRRWSFGWGLIFLFWDLSIGLGSCCSPPSGSTSPSPTAYTKPQSVASWYRWFNRWCWVFWFEEIEGLVGRVRQVCGITGGLCRLSGSGSRLVKKYLDSGEVASGVGGVLGLSGSFKIHMNQSEVTLYD